MNKKQMKKLAKEYDVDDYSNYVTTVGHKIEGFYFAQFGYCCRDLNGYILGIRYGGIYSNEGHIPLQFPLSTNDHEKLDKFCAEKKLSTPKLYMVAEDCRVCGS